MSTPWSPPPPPGTGAEPPPGAPLPPGAWPAAPQYGPPGWQPPPRTNGLAIGSLITGCAQVVIWPLAFLVAIAAIVMGHMARHQIRRTGEKGAGLALAGLIIGYVGVVLWGLFVSGILVFVFGFAPGIAQRQARDHARDFGAAIVGESAVMARDARDANVVRAAYEREREAYRGCCVGDGITLADGTPTLYATNTDFERSGWRLQLSHSVIWTRYACLTVPAAAGVRPLVVDGRCN